MTVPAGFERLLLGHAIAVARSDLAPFIRQALVASDGKKATLHQYAAQHPGARPLQGRGTAYAVPLPNGETRVVVRHNRHGGMFAPLTRDLFLAPTRAPLELDVSRALTRAGVPTPEVVAYAVYPPGALLQRSDVCSREIADGHDLAEILMQAGHAERAAALESAGALVATLSRAGAMHPDLNAKNILIAAGGTYVLDVDRVLLRVDPQAALGGNLERLSRSLRKWRDKSGAAVSETDIAALRRASGAA